MKKKIKELLSKIDEAEKALYAEVEKLPNINNECDCDDEECHDFSNILDEGDCPNLCLNCGGYCSYQDDWGM